MVLFVPGDENIINAYCHYILLSITNLLTTLSRYWRHRNSAINVILTLTQLFRYYIFLTEVLYFKILF